MLDEEQPPALKLLRLHADCTDTLWYGHDELPYECANVSSAAVYLRPETLGIGLERANEVRLLGVADNAALVLGLKRLHQDNPKLARTQRVLLGSPHVCPSATLRANPDVVLQTLWQPPPTSALSGCWHQMGRHDYVSYSIVHELAATKWLPSDMARRSLRYHPAWPALSFLAGLDEDAACRLIATVIEPRWFRHPFHPSRLSRLNSYLGLTPANMAAFVSGGEGDRHYERAKTVLETWSHGFKHSMTGPGGFLHRIADKAPDGQYHIGLLKASTRFVRFLFEVWTAESAFDYEAKFEPGLFFKRPEEVAAYAAHRRSLRV